VNPLERIKEKMDARRDEVLENLEAYGDPLEALANFGVLLCPRCGSANLNQLDRFSDITCLDCGLMFEPGEAGL